MTTTQRPRQTVTHLTVTELTAHPANVRTNLGDLDELTLSIRQVGILQPLTVTEHPDSGYVLLAGHRRLGAAINAGLTRVPVVIRHDVTDTIDQLSLMLIENCQREDLHPIDRAQAYGALRNRGLTIGDIARRTGTSGPNVSRYLMLLDLPEPDREQLRTGHHTLTDAVRIVREARDAERRRERPTGGPIGRPKGRKTTPHFSTRHPLAATVTAICDHRGVPKVGGVGCGPCWEAAIRADTPSTQKTP